MKITKLGRSQNSTGVLGSLQAPSKSSAQIFGCTDPQVFSRKPMATMTLRQLSNTLNDLLGATVYNQVSNDLSPIIGGSNSTLITSASQPYGLIELKAINQLTIDAASVLSANPNLLASISDPCASGTVDLTCATKIINSFGLRALRRPVTQAELTNYQSLFSNSGAGLTGAVAIVRAMILSPQFLFLSENGDESQPLLKGDIFALTQYEIASRLSYMLWDSMPDSALFSAAAAGTLGSKSQIVAQVKRMFSAGRTAAKFSNFISYWLATDSVGQVPTNPGITAGLDSASLATLQTDMVSELQEFVSTVVWQNGGNFSDLMTSNLSFARSPALASVYGHAPAAPGQSATMSVARGVLARLPFLADSSAQTNPILRGVFVNFQILCNQTGPPVAGAAADLAGTLTAAQIAALSTRDRITDVVSAPTCMGCHSIINPPGYALEGFDAIGRARQIETDYSSNGSVAATHSLNLMTPITSQGQTYTLRGLTDLQNLAAQPSQGAACYVRQMFRFYREQLEDTATNQDACLMASVLDQMENNSSQSLQEALAEIIANDYTLYNQVGQ